MTGCCRYPDGLAWQLNLERKVIRHNEVLTRLKQFLVTETESVSDLLQIAEPTAVKGPLRG